MQENEASNEDHNYERFDENDVRYQGVGDYKLIQLYRERRYLYDKTHNDFRNNLAKENGWKEISQIMSSEGKYTKS